MLSRQLLYCIFFLFRCNWSFVFDPAGRLCYYWSMVVSFAFLYNFWVIIFRFSFAEITMDSLLIWFRFAKIDDSFFWYFYSQFRANRPFYGPNFKTLSISALTTSWTWSICWTSCSIFARDIWKTACCKQTQQSWDSTIWIPPLFTWTACVFCRWIFSTSH